jgi:hypothetical protein
MVDFLACRPIGINGHGDGGGNIFVPTNCDDCEIPFSSDDY